MALKPGQTGRVYPHISECGLQKALDFLSKELTIQGVKELWADSLDSFIRDEGADTCASVIFETDEEKFKPSEIEDVFYNSDKGASLYIEGLCNKDTMKLREKGCYPHKFCVWKEGVWNLCQ